MVAKTLTISMSAEDFEYLMKDHLLSPSKIFQAALFNIREQRKYAETEIKLLEKRNDILTKKLWEANDNIHEITNGNKKID